MPNYIYSCKQCGKEFQLKLAWREKEHAACPECGSHNLQELLGRYAFGVTTRQTRAAAQPACAGCDNPRPGCPMVQ